MKTNYWPLGFAVVVASLGLPWFDPVTTPRFNALNFPFAHSAYLWPSFFAFFSYGTGMLVATALIFLAWWKGKGLVVFCGGVVLLFAALTFYLQIASWEPSWLKAALTGGQDYEHCYRFEVAYTIPNSTVVSPAKGLIEPVQGLGDRFSAASSTLGVGWPFFVFGAIWVCGAGLAQMNDWETLGLAVPALAVLFGLFGFLQLWRPLAAERALAAAQVAEAHGAFKEAEGDLQRAMQTDEWHRLDAQVLIRLGNLHKKMGLQNRPDVLLAEAAELNSRGLQPEALFQYSRAAATGDQQVRRIALLEKAAVAARYAGTLYRQGVIGDAFHYWQISIEAAPNLINAYYGAGRASYDVADYRRAIKYLDPVFEKTSQNSLLANTYNYLGDCYYRLGDLDDARSYYMASRKSDDRSNFRALKTLTESYYR